MLKVVAAVFQQIMTDLNGAESEEDRTLAIPKIVLKIMKQKTNDYAECRQVNL
jgi:N-acetylneuraminic acid mutarotase